MFSKTIRYLALALAVAFVIALVLSMFLRKDDKKEIKAILKSSADSIEYARQNITSAQNRIDSLVLKIDSVNNVMSAINDKVKNGNEAFHTLLQKNIEQINVLKEQVAREQSEIDKLREQLKQLK